MDGLIQRFEGTSALKEFILHGVKRNGVTLGVGSFGRVEEVVIAGTKYAGKIWHQALMDPRNEGVGNMTRRFVTECQLMSQARHPNIVQFIGICFLEDQSSYPVLVMERLHTCLDSVLESKRTLVMGFKLQVLLDILKGLNHLHNMNPLIVHRDLTTRNVLLNNDSLRAKIADLGNARMIEPGKLSKTLSQSPGTQVYMPPEATHIKPEYDASLDMFSFGHLMLYVVIETFPYNLLPATYHDPKTYRLLPRSELERRDQYTSILYDKLGKKHIAVSIIERCLDI